MPEKDITERHLESYNDVFCGHHERCPSTGKDGFSPTTCAGYEGAHPARRTVNSTERERTSSCVGPGRIVISLIGFMNKPGSTETCRFGCWDTRGRITATSCLKRWPLPRVVAGPFTLAKRLDEASVALREGPGSR